MGMTLVLLAPVVLLLFFLLLDSLLRVWLVLVSLLPSHAAPPAPDHPQINLAVVIPAHDEAAVIGETVARLREGVPADALFVVADHCSDDTAEVARRAGARVWERAALTERGTLVERGKGGALRWFMATAASELCPFDGLAVLDADSQVDERFLSHAGAALAQGAEAVQGFVQPLSGGSPAADLAAYSELLSQCIDDRARTRLHWPVPLRGTGMAFRRPVLQALLSSLQTRVEDVEMSLLLAAQGRRVQFVPSAVVGDPKPLGVRRVAVQRARWLQGQREVWQRHGRLAFRLLFGGRPGHVSLVFAVLLKPKTLLFALKAALFAGLLFWPLAPAGLHRGAVWLAGLALSADLVYYIVGLKFVETPSRYARALILSPLYGAAWLWSLILSLLSTSPWLSVRRDGKHRE